MKIYYWLFSRARHPFALWAWRKWSGVLTAAKHIQRRNWTQAGVWLRWTIGQ